MARFMSRIFRYVIVLSLFASLIHLFLQKKSYTFAHREVHKVAEKFVGQHPSQCLPKLVTDLRRRYSVHILPDTEHDWFTYSSGGMKGKALILSASLTEYVAVFGTPLQTTGHTGFQWVNQSCTLLVGSVERWKDGNVLTREEHGPGDYIRFPMLQSSVVRFGDDTWLVCYGRGFLPTSMPYYLVDNLLLTYDFPSIGRFLYTSWRGFIRETGNWVQETFEYYTKH